MLSCRLIVPAGKCQMGIYPFIFDVNRMYQKGNRMVWIQAFLGLVIMVSLSISVVSASPQLPCEFYGTVTISGSPAPAGTVITAYVNSVKQGSITVKEPGKYGGVGTFDERLIVLAGENDFTGGAPVITFKIGDKTADLTSPYSPGMSTELALTTGGGAPAALAPVSGTSGPVQAMSAAPAVPTTSPAPAVPTTSPAPAVVAPAGTSPISGPAPVVTLAAPQSSTVILAVSTQVAQAPAASNQSALPGANVTPTQIPPVVVCTPVAGVLPVVPVVTATPVPAVQPMAAPVVPVVTATPVPPVTPTVVPVVPVVTVPPVPTSASATAPVIPVVTVSPVPANQSNGVNVTNTTILSNNTSVTVSFPSGQNITR